MLPFPKRLIRAQVQFNHGFHSYGCGKSFPLDAKFGSIVDLALERMVKQEDMYMASRQVMCADDDPDKRAKIVASLRYSNANFRLKIPGKNTLRLAFIEFGHRELKEAISMWAAQFLNQMAADYQVLDGIGHCVRITSVSNGGMVWDHYSSVKEMRNASKGIPPWDDTSGDNSKRRPGFLG